MQHYWSRALSCFNSFGALALVCLRRFDQTAGIRWLKATKTLPFWESFVPRRQINASSRLWTHFFKQERGDSHYNCHVAMEANTRRPTRPTSAQKMVPTEYRMMSAHMRADHRVGKQQRPAVKACRASIVTYRVLLSLSGLHAVRAGPRRVMSNVCAQISCAVP